MIIADGLTKVYDEDVLSIPDHPETLWIIHNGWYMYQNEPKHGWYFKSIINQEILPVFAVNLSQCSLA